ncbi:DNA-binding protein [Rhodopseudomonas sp. B29]|uniref:helix-turn-helix domain-containing transcriptional regulator n=1 Tax=Rhodopseudomonas sp. B29 TaxID=95607 RepID=UPI00034856F3|nr:hypothetical protein [Rhodopseudomonas sp. B29]
MKVSKLKKFKAAEHLRTPEARAEYLNIVHAVGDPDEVRVALDLVAQTQRTSAIAKAPDNDGGTEGERRSENQSI